MSHEMISVQDLPALDARLTSVIRYWDELRDGRPAPGRVELRPAALTRHLSRICVLERPRAGTVRVRLAGSTLSTRMGMELRGMPFRALFELDERAKAMAAAEIAIATPAVSILSLSRQERTGPSAEAMLAILPLTDMRGALTRALAVYSERPAIAPYVSKIRGRFVISRSWSFDIPENGRLLGAFGNPAHLRPTMSLVSRSGTARAAARLVAVEDDQRPQFQVIDGGLA